jgi:hypothetical protein
MVSSEIPSYSSNITFCAYLRDHEQFVINLQKKKYNYLLQFFNNILKKNYNSLLEIKYVHCELFNNTDILNIFISSVNDFEKHFKIEINPNDIIKTPIRILQTLLKKINLKLAKSKSTTHFYIKNIK